LADQVDDQAEVVQEEGQCSVQDIRPGLVSPTRWRLCRYSHSTWNRTQYLVGLSSSKVRTMHYTVDSSAPSILLAIQLKSAVDLKVVQPFLLTIFFVPPDTNSRKKS